MSCRSTKTRLHIRVGRALTLRNLPPFNRGETKCIGNLQDASVTEEFCCDCHVSASFTGRSRHFAAFSARKASENPDAGRGVRLRGPGAAGAHGIGALAVPTAVGPPPRQRRQTPARSRCRGATWGHRRPQKPGEPPGSIKFAYLAHAAPGFPGVLNFRKICPRLCPPTPPRSPPTTNSTPRRRRGLPCFPSP